MAGNFSVSQRYGIGHEVVIVMGYLKKNLRKDFGLPFILSLSLSCSFFLVVSTYIDERNQQEKHFFLNSLPQEQTVFLAIFEPSILL